MRFKAKILPDFLTLHEDCIGIPIPLIREHQIYSKPIGHAIISKDNTAVLVSDEIKVGDKLSAGSMIMQNNRHDVREVSVVEDPKYSECEVLEVLDDKPNDI